MIEQDPNARFHVSSIHAGLIDRFWKFAEPYIKRALDHTSGEFTADNIRDLCKNQYIQLWLVTEGSKVIGAATTEIVIYPNRKHLRVCTLAGSNATEWAADIDTILDDCARSEGCDAIEAFVRKGYVPILQKRGYAFKNSTVVKKVE